MHNCYHSNISGILYVHGHELQCTTIHGALPLLLSPLADPFCLPLCSPFSPLLLTWNPPCCDRIRPPRSQVACKLTSLDPTLSPNPPPSKFPEPQLPSASLRRPQEQPRVFCQEHICSVHPCSLLSNSNWCDSLFKLHKTHRICDQRDVFKRFNIK
jgi:hypothetical protein